MNSNPLSVCISSILYLNFFTIISINLLDSYVLCSFANHITLFLVYSSIAVYYLSFISINSFVIHAFGIYFTSTCTLLLDISLVDIILAHIFASLMELYYIFPILLKFYINLLYFFYILLALI